MAFAATMEALTDAGLFPVPDELRAETGVVIGGGAGGMLECEPVYRDHLLGARRALNYSTFAGFNCASSADRIAGHLGLMGPKTTFMTACSSGATAVGYAGDLIRTGARRSPSAAAPNSCAGSPTPHSTPCRPSTRTAAGRSTGTVGGCRWARPPASWSSSSWRTRVGAAPASTANSSGTASAATPTT